MSSPVAHASGGGRRPPKKSNDKSKPRVQLKRRTKKKKRRKQAKNKRTRSSSREERDERQQRTTRTELNFNGDVSTVEYRNDKNSDVRVDTWTQQHGRDSNRAGNHHRHDDHHGDRMNFSKDQRQDNHVNNTSDNRQDNSRSEDHRGATNSNVTAVNSVVGDTDQQAECKIEEAKAEENAADDDDAMDGTYDPPANADDDEADDGDVDSNVDGTYTSDEEDSAP